MDSVPPVSEDHTGRGSPGGGGSMEAGVREEAGAMRRALISNALGRFHCCGLRGRSQQLVIFRRHR